MSRPKAIIPITAEINQGHNWMIYGEPGVGKTMLACSAPNTLLIRPPTDNVISAAILGTTAQQWIVSDHTELNEVYEYLRQEKDHGFDWVWLDTITLFQELGLEGIMIDLHAQKSHREVWLPDKGEFGQNMTRISMFARGMKALPVNFGVVAHVMKAENLQGELQYMPAIQGRGMPERICGYMTLVGYLEVVEKGGTEVRRLITSNKKELIYAKDGYGGAFGGRVIDPTVPKMLKVIGNKVTVKKAAPQKAVPVKKAAKKAATPRKKVQ